MVSKHPEHAKLLKSIQKSSRKGRKTWQRYQARNGQLSLATHIFMSSPTQGFPVLVKSNTDAAVTCRMLQTGEEFTVSMSEYDAHRGRDFLLNATLEKTDPETFEEHAQWLRDAYDSVGIKLSGVPDLSQREEKHS